MIINCLNTVLGSQGSLAFWRVEIKEILKKQFYNALTEEEENSTFNLNSRINISQLMMRWERGKVRGNCVCRVLQLTSVKMTPQAMRELTNDPKK